MNDEAFARRFYADRAELEALGSSSRSTSPPRATTRRRTTRAAARELLPAGYRVHEQGARRAARGAVAARREFAYAEPLRLALQQLSWGEGLAARRARGAFGRPGRHRQPGQARPLAADCPRSRRRSSAARRSSSTTTRSAATRRSRAGGPLPPALPRRPVLPDRPLPGAGRHPRLPGVEDPRQGRLRLQGRARLLAPGGVRPAPVRRPHGLAAGRRSARPGSGSPTASTGSCSATSRTPAGSAPPRTTTA